MFMNLSKYKHMLRLKGFNPVLIGIVRILRALKARYLIVRMDTNHLCNLTCRMCYFGSQKEMLKKEISKPLFNKVAQEIFPKARALYLSCYAEPLCSPNIYSFIQIAKKKHKVPFVSLTTNAMLLTKGNTDKIIEAGIDEVTVSISGGCKETYEYCHRGASWTTLWENLKYFTEVIKNKRAKTRLSVNFILNKKSIEEVKPISSLLKQCGVKYVNLRSLIPFRDMNMEFYEEYRISNLNKDAISSVLLAFKRNGITAVGSLQCNQSKIPVAEKHPCILPYFSLFINSEAYVKFCLYREWEFSLDEMTFSEILKSNRHMRFTESLKARSTASCLGNCALYGTNKEFS